jgi:hypothetical protein
MFERLGVEPDGLVELAPRESESGGATREVDARIARWRRCSGRRRRAGE